MLQVSTWLCCIEAVCEATLSHTYEPKVSVRCPRHSNESEGTTGLQRMSPKGGTPRLPWVLCNESWLV
jgi:hypothetical protein